MFNPWTIQQVAAIQMAAAIQQQPTELNYGMNPPMRAAQYTFDESSDDDEDDEGKRTLFCANLDERITEEILYEVFMQAGPVESVRIPRDNTGKNRTFGFVTYMHQCTAPYAIVLFQGLTLFRKSITIKAQGKKEQSPVQRRNALPSDCVAYQQRRGGGGNSSGSKYDNSALRGSSYPAYYDISMNDSGNSPNPFRKDISNWTIGSGGKQTSNERISKHSSTDSRTHTKSTPYQRSESSRRSGGDSKERDHGNHNNRGHHNGNNRRSEQRSNSRR